MSPYVEEVRQQTRRPRKAIGAGSMRHPLQVLIMTSTLRIHQRARLTNTCVLLYMCRVSAPSFASGPKVILEGIVQGEPGMGEGGHCDPIERGQVGAR